MQAIVRIILFSFGVLFVQLASALQVTPGSSCSALCLSDPESDAQSPSSSYTTPSEIACRDGEYAESPVAIKYKNCMECLQKSNATSQVESDTTWFLYNARYSIDVCIYGFGNGTKRISTPCDVNNSCKNIKTALMTGNLNPDLDPLEYCSANGSAFSGAWVDNCISCYASTDETSYLANFLTALKAGCKQQPQNGALLGLSSTIFSSSLVEITDPPADTELGPLPGSSSFMTTGAIVGIVVGAGLLFLGGTGLFCVYHRKQKRLYADFPKDMDSGRGSRRRNQGPSGTSWWKRRHNGTPSDRRSIVMSVSPPLLLHPGAQRSLAPTPDTIDLAKTAASSSITQKDSVESMRDYGLRTQHGYISNGAYYDQLEKGMQLRSSTTSNNTTTTRNAIMSMPTISHFPQCPPATHTLPTHPAYNPQTHSRQQSRDALLLTSSSLSASSPPLPAARSNKPDSYALQAYLNAAEAAEQHVPANAIVATTTTSVTRSNNPYRTALTGAAPLTNPAITKILASSGVSTQHEQQQTRSASPALSLASTAISLSASPAVLGQLSPPPPPPPPPPPVRPAVPSLSMPSISKVRVPKKYPPPHIKIVDSNTAIGGGGGSTICSPSALASPTSQQGDLPIGIQIGGPLGAHPVVSGPSSSSYYDARIAAARSQGRDASRGRELAAQQQRKASPWVKKL